jgi:hypothetical protein
VLVVWEPMLLTDWGSPSKSAQARIPDNRVQQFWDPSHVVASALAEFAKQRPGQPLPRCCVQKGFNWDEVVLYAPHSEWANAPPAVFWNGPIAKVISGLESALKEHVAPG